MRATPLQESNTPVLKPGKWSGKWLHTLTPWYNDEFHQFSSRYTIMLLWCVCITYKWDHRTYNKKHTFEFHCETDWIGHWPHFKTHVIVCNKKIRDTFLKIIIKLEERRFFPLYISASPSPDWWPLSSLIHSAPSQSSAIHLLSSASEPWFSRSALDFTLYLLSISFPQSVLCLVELRFRTALCRQQPVRFPIFHCARLFPDHPRPIQPCNNFLSII